MRIRWLLPLAAAAFLAGVAWLVLHGSGVSPEQRLAGARARIAAEPPDRAGARRALDAALRRAQGPEHAALRAEILKERAHVYALDDLPELALADCRAVLEALGPDPETLDRACTLYLDLGQPGNAIELAERLSALDAVRGQGHFGRGQVALADAALASLARLVTSSLPPSRAEMARTLAQRAAIFADDAEVSSAALQELAELLPGSEGRRAALEWVREAGEHMQTARRAFLASLGPDSSSEAVAGLQDLLLRGGVRREAADLGLIALSDPELAHPMPVLARTASALVDLERRDTARELILDVRRRSSRAVQPAALPSLALRNELEEWCRLLDELELWNELRSGAWELQGRCAQDRPRLERALVYLATAAASLGDVDGARRWLETLGTSASLPPELSLRVWLLWAAVARREGQRTQERFALLTATRTAPLDPPAHMRAEVASAWERLSELQLEDQDLLGAEISLTHTLRLSSERAEEIEPKWHAIGNQAVATRGAASPYLLYAHAKDLEERGATDQSLADARTLLAGYPGLGPALAIVSRSAQAQRNFPVMIAAALEILERGWPAAEASALLRAVPEEFFLPQDRVRWLLLDPRGSVEAVVRKLLERGDLQGAARAARAGSAKQQPAELLPLLARVELEAGYSGVALETLSALAVEGQPFRSCTAVALRAALQQALASMPPHALAATVERVLASGPAEDPGLPSAIDSLLATGHMAEAEALLAWLAPQSPPFLAELLLRQAAARLIAGAARLQDDDLERAAALLEDGRPDLGRMLLAFERDEAPPLAREARAALSTPLSEAPGRRAALLFLAGEPERAAELVARAALDGRDFLLELVAGCLGTGARAAREELPGLSGFLQESVPPGSALLLALASEIPPFSAWSLERTAELPLGTRQDPWMRVLRAQAWLALGLHEQGLAELSSAGEEPDDARGAWVRARLLRARGAAPEERLQAELDWLVASGRAQNAAADAELELALLRSALAARAGAREEAVRVLEAALEAHPQDRTLLGRLAELEDTPGRRTRALELQTQLIDALPARDAAPEVLAFLDVLRVARREDEISEARWWSEVEALEAARPMDPAPVRELAARAFERAGPPDGPGRADALGRLTRFRSRTLERPLEGLRVGETERWTRLLARHAPERAVAFAEAELRLDPADPALWRASAEALLAAGRTPAAIERLEALQRVAPDLPSARTLALTRFRLTNDAQQLGVDLTRLRSLHPEAEADPVLRFYSALAGTGAKRFLTSVEEVMRLWSERGANGLSGDSEHGRRLALWLYKHGSKAHALGVLTDVLELAQGALERDVLTALARLMEAAPAAERGRARAERPAAPRPDDAPAANGGAAREHADAATRSRAKGPAKPGASRAGDAKTPPAKKRADKPATPARRPQK